MREFSPFVSHTIIRKVFFMGKTFLVVFFIGCSLFAQEREERKVYLKNGDQISGTFISESDSSLVLQTSFGAATILKSDIKPRSISLYLKDGNKISGDVISKNDKEIILKTSFGIVNVELDKIERTTEVGEVLPGTQQKKEYYYSTERLVDIFFDPTGYTLEKGTVYFSGLSWGVALSENIDISSSYWRYFFADLNIRPKFRIYSSGNIEQEKSLAVGFHLHSAGPTGKQKFTTSSYQSYPYTTSTQSEWSAVGNEKDYFLWTEVFAAFTQSYLKEDKQGRFAYHLGASVIFHKEETMPRVWFALENDITDRFKILGEVFYDPFQPSYRERAIAEQTKNPLDLDLGFVYTYSESFRIGIHYQPYVVLFYYKF
jgi:hypothetical protein